MKDEEPQQIDLPPQMKSNFHQKTFEEVISINIINNIINNNNNNNNKLE